MYKVLESMLEDGHPDLPFILSWENEPWTRTTNRGNRVEVLLPQTYGHEPEWEDHFQYLCRFFDHPSYMRRNGAPIFVLGSTKNMREVLVPMLRCWRRLALNHGFSGLHIINALGSSVHHPDDVGTVDAASHYWPHLFNNFDIPKSKCASTEDLPLPSNQTIQYWGSFAGFGERFKNCEKDTNFETDLKESFAQMARSSRSFAPNIFFHTAWNEWKNQAVLEPSTTSGFTILEAIRSALNQMPIRIISESEFC
uniref:Uncharacterized protein n=1 Tax=Octactis speculum TaxID=3111310 RepID=A0A6U3RQQ5_9STRA|mmetsp:Transcript_24298/g.33285  ORF Transcript_24298/g.33285 Transcript_24298/m.33285 type:complete len:253 (+) Transcript_24298:214-972(+)